MPLRVVASIGPSFLYSLLELQIDRFGTSPLSYRLWHAERRHYDSVLDRVRYSFVQRVLPCPVDICTRISASAVQRNNDTCFLIDIDSLAEYSPGTEYTVSRQPPEITVTTVSPGWRR
jgi:hypothetical protein